MSQKLAESGRELSHVEEGRLQGLVRLQHGLEGQQFVSGHQVDLLQMHPDQVRPRTAPVLKVWKHLVDADELVQLFLGETADLIWLVLPVCLV